MMSFSLGRKKNKNAIWKILIFLELVLVRNHLTAIALDDVYGLCILNIISSSLITLRTIDSKTRSLKLLARKIPTLGWSFPLGTQHWLGLRRGYRRNRGNVSSTCRGKTFLKAQRRTVSSKALRFSATRISPSSNKYPSVYSSCLGKDDYF